MELYNGNIIDPIHGMIRVSDIEKWFMNQKQFGRLRWIRQNTFVYYVFPSANHTRFEHSIGVMHLANEIFKNVILNFKSGKYRKTKHEIKTTPKGFEFLDIEHLYSNDNTRNLRDIHLQELRLAALMHDIGHGPLSHKFDSYSLKKEEFLKIVSSDDSTKKYLGAFKKLLGKKERIDHEHLSCLFILELVAALKKDKNDNANKFFKELSEMVDDISAERIVRLIEPKLKFGDEGKMLVDGIDLTNLYSTIISSFPVDADRMDYLLRDGTFTGVKYGVYDLSRLYASFMPLKVNNEGYLGIKQSGIDACVRFIESRTHLFNIVYPHKTNVSASTMLDFIFKDFSDSVIKAENYKQLVDFYWTNSDEHFIRNTIKATLIETSEETTRGAKQKVLDMLLQRRMWKPIHFFRFTISTQTKKEDELFVERNKKLEALVKSINSKLEKLTIHSRANLFINKVFKDSDKSELRIIEKNYKSYKLIKGWKTNNKELSAMDYKVGFFRIYIDRDFESSNDFTLKSDTVINEVRAEIENFEKLANSPL